MTLLALTPIEIRDHAVARVDLNLRLLEGRPRNYVELTDPEEYDDEWIECFLREHEEQL